MDIQEVTMIGPAYKHLEKIVEIHKNIPGAWQPNHTVSIREVDIARRSFEERLKLGKAFCFVLEKQGELIAYLWAEANEKDNEFLDIMSVWTHHSYRNKGKARALKVAFENWALRSKRFSKIRTTISSGNKVMLAINEELGYQISFISMEKPLDK